MRPDRPEPRDRTRTAQARREAIHKRQLRDWLADAQAQTGYRNWSARVAQTTARAARDVSPRSTKP